MFIWFILGKVFSVSGGATWVFESKGEVMRIVSVMIDLTPMMLDANAQIPIPTRDECKSKCIRNPSLSNNAMCRENQKPTHLRKDAPQDPYHTSTL